MSRLRRLAHRAFGHRLRYAVYAPAKYGQGWRERAYCLSCAKWL